MSTGLFEKNETEIDSWIDVLLTTSLNDINFLLGWLDELIGQLLQNPYEAIKLLKAEDLMAETLAVKDIERYCDK